MKYSKKIFVSMAVALCISFMTGVISHAETLQYKEISYGYPFGKKYVTESFSMCINTSGKLSLQGIGSYPTSFVTYNSKKKKTVKQYKNKNLFLRPKAVYGNRSYSIDSERGREKLFVFKIKGNIITKKVIKKIDLEKITKKYLRDKDDDVDRLEIWEILRKNVVRIFFHVSEPNGPDYIGGHYAGILDVNITTGKDKKVVLLDEFYPRCYDGKYVYSMSGKDGKITFRRVSLKSKKIESFTADDIEYDDKNYPYSVVEPYFYNGQIMALCPSGKVYYGTFKSKKFELVGKISKGKHFKKYAALDFVMKSKKEFYIAYGTRAKRSKENDSSINGKIFVDKYTCN